jgi:surface-anchored protein
MLRSKLTCVVAGTIAALPALGMAAEAKVYTSEHVDHVSVNYGSPADTGIDEHKLLLTSRDEDNKVEHDNGPNSLVYMPEDSSAGKLTAPGSGSFGFLGDAGDDVWAFPQSNDPLLPFVGVSTEDKTGSGGWSGGILNDPDLASFRGLGIQPGELEDDQVNLELLNMSGPDGGDFKFYNTDFFGAPTVFMDTEDGIDSSDSRTLGPNVHEHYNWAFTEPGLYKLTFQASGTPKATGETITSAPSDFYFGVGTQTIPEPASLTLLGLGAATLIGRRRRVSDNQ